MLFFALSAFGPVAVLMLSAVTLHAFGYDVEVRRCLRWQIPCGFEVTLFEWRS